MRGPSIQLASRRLRAGADRDRPHMPEAVEKRAIGVDDALRLAAMEVEAAVNRLARLA